MKECDNSTRKIHISSNFILSTSLLIMFDTLLLRPSLHCNTLLHFNTLHPTTLCYTSPHFTQLHFTILCFTSPNYTSLHFTSSHLHFSTLSFSFTHLHFLSFYFTSHHIARHSTVLISKPISKLMNPFTALKNFSPFHFTSLHFLCPILYCLVHKTEFLSFNNSFYITLDARRSITFTSFLLR
jgi:hypothetical protein